MFEFEVVTLPAVAFSGTPVWQTVSAIQFGCILIIYNNINIISPPQRVSLFNPRFFLDTVEV